MLILARFFRQFHSTDRLSLEPYPKTHTFHCESSWFYVSPPRLCLHFVNWYRILFIYGTSSWASKKCFHRECRKRSCRSLAAPLVLHQSYRTSLTSHGIAVITLILGSRVVLRLTQVPDRVNYVRLVPMESFCNTAILGFYNGRVPLTLLERNSQLPPPGWLSRIHIPQLLQVQLPSGLYTDVFGNAQWTHSYVPTQVVTSS